VSGARVSRERRPLAPRVLRTWRGQHGNCCPGYERDAHTAADLTFDRVAPLQQTVPLDITKCAVCRSCNSTCRRAVSRAAIDSSARKP